MKPTEIGTPHQGRGPGGAGQCVRSTPNGPNGVARCRIGSCQVTPPSPTISCFSTKNRTPVLRRERRDDLFRYIWGIIKNRHNHLYRISGVENHLHILSSLHPTVSLADFVKEVNTSSALWIKENRVFKSFTHWQEGYDAFTCSRRDIGRPRSRKSIGNCFSRPGLNSRPRCLF